MLFQLLVMNTKLLTKSSAYLLQEVLTLLLTLGFFVCGWHIALVATHIPMHIRDKGLEDWTATAILALIGLFNVFGTLSSGYLSTKISKKKLLSAIYLLRGVSLIYFVFMPPSVVNALIFGITFGYLWLATVPPTNAIGFSFLAPPLYFIVISLEGSSLPLPTESRQFIPIDFISFSL